jgi:hypothetical protein
MEVKIDADELCELRKKAETPMSTFCYVSDMASLDRVRDERDKARAAAEFWKQKAYDMLEVAEIRRDTVVGYGATLTDIGGLAKRHEFDSDEGKF